MYAPYNFTTSKVVTANLVAALLDKKYFSSGDHVQVQKDGWAVIKNHNTTNTLHVLNGVTGKLLTPQVKGLKLSSKTGACISV